MKTLWEQVECAMTKRVYRNVVIRNYMKFEMWRSYFHINGTNEEEQIFAEITNSKGGYFYCKNLLVGEGPAGTKSTRKKSNRDNTERTMCYTLPSRPCTTEYW